MRAAALVSVAAGAARQHPSAWPSASGVHRPEAGRGEGGEHARMTGDRFGHAFAAGQAGSDDLAGVVLVDLGARRAGFFAAVAAGNQQNLTGFGVGVVDEPGLAGGAVNGLDVALQPDGVGAVAGVDELFFPAVEVVAGGELKQGPGRCPHPQAVIIGSGGESNGRDRHAVVISRTRDRARCLSGSGRIRVRLSRVSQLRAVRTWSRYSPAAWTRP